MSSSLEARLRRQAGSCAQAGSPLTAALLTGAADDLAVPGPVRDLLAPLSDDPAGSLPSLRLAGALHRLVLQRRAPGLALHYPSVGGTAGPDGAWDAAREVVRTEPDLYDLVRRPVQTNEVGRSAVLFGGLRHVVARTGLPVRLLEVGASAGLNLRVDAYAYGIGGRTVGDARSPVRLHEPWSGPVPPDVPVQLTSRLGCDPAPLEPTATADRLTLTSYVWADQVERLERLRGALAVAAQLPASVEALTASAFLERELAEPVPGVVTVVWHSLVWQYLAPDEKAAVTRLLDRAGARATPTAPLARLTHEPRNAYPPDPADLGEEAFPVMLTTWPGGAPTVLAGAQGHGPPVVWR